MTAAGGNVSNNRAALGKAAEDYVLTNMRNNGYRLLERNFNCRGGELDLVMLDRDELVFVEVRYRRSDAYGGASESVDQRKQRKLRIAAETWLQRNDGLAFRQCRFDVAAVSGAVTNFSLHWINDAF